MSIMENIVRLQQPESNVYNLIQTYLTSVGLDSEDTAKAYATDIKDFFRLMLDKELNQLTIDDLKFENHEIEVYKIELTKHYAGSTVNRKIASLRSLFNWLAKNNVPNANPTAFKVKNVKHQTRSYGSLTPDEGIRMIELAKSLPKGDEKAAIIAIAMSTGFRLNAILKAKWSDVQYNEQQGYWTLTLIDKGGDCDTMPFDESVYQLLSVIKKPEQEEIFTLSPSTCERLVKKLANMMDIPEYRNITFHSLRKTGINYAIDIENDLKMAVAQGRHKNSSTTMKYYIERHKDMSNMPGLLMMQSIDLSIFESMSKEELLSLIKSADRQTQRILIKQAKKKGNQ